MATYDSQGNLTDETPGLGFASAPGTQVMTPTQGDASVAESVGFKPTATSGMQAAPAQSQSLGFAAQEQPQQPTPRSQSDQEYIASLPASRRFALAVGELDADLQGKPSPTEALLQRKHAEEARNQKYIIDTIKTIHDGTEILRRMPEGMARDAVAEQLGKAVGGGDLAKVFKTVGDQGSEVKAVLSTFSDPDVQTQLLKSCNGTADFRACVMTQARDKDFMDRAHSMADSKRMPDIVRKLSAVSDQIGKTAGALDEFKTADGKYEIPFAKLIELNAKAKIFTPEEMDTIRRNEGMLSPFGIKTTKALEAGDVERAKVAERNIKVGTLKQYSDEQGRQRTAKWDGDTWVDPNTGDAVTFGAKKDRPAPADKPLTLAQERADESVRKAREEIGAMDKAEMVRKRAATLPNGKDNPDYDPEVGRNWRLSQQPLFADVKAKRDAAKGKPAPSAPAAAPTADASPKAAAAADKFTLSNWENTKKIHGLSDAELEKRLGRKKPAK